MSSARSAGAWLAVAVALAALALLWHSNARLEQSLLEVERGAISLDESAAREEARSLGRLLGLAPGAGSDARKGGHDGRRAPRRR